MLRKGGDVPNAAGRKTCRKEGRKEERKKEGGDKGRED
jgi:hypothetical protein